VLAAAAERVGRGQQGQRYLLGGVGVLAIVSITVTAVRLFGLAVDGTAPFTFRVLKPEIALVLLSTLGFALESRRLRGDVTHAGLRAPSGAGLSR
jgi:hypothetical protein